MSSINKDDLKNKNLFIILLVLVLIVVVYGLIFKYLGRFKWWENAFCKIIIIWIFTFLVLVNGLKYFFNYELVENVEEEEKVDEPEQDKETKVDDSRLLFNNRATNDALTNSRKGGKKEVFHIGDNVYTFNEAKMICNA